MACEGYPTTQDALNFKTNADDIDEFVTSTEDTFTDRFGNSHLTITGIAKKGSYTAPVAYEAGISFTTDDLLKTVEEDGVVYAPLPSELPFTTTDWTTDESKFYVVQGVTSDNLGVQEVTSTGSTTPRKLEDRFADVVNVKDFGAVGDGATDDYLAVQAALDYVNLTGGKLVFPEGEYLINSHLDITDMNNVEVSGASRGNSIIRLNAGVNFYIRGATDSGFSDISIKGTRHDTEYQSIWLSAYARFSWRNCQFSDFAGVAINKPGSTIMYMYANSDVGPSTAAGDSHSGVIDNCVFLGHDRLTNFAVRVYTEFGGTNTGTNTGNHINNSTFDEFNWNALEIAGPNTSHNMVTNCIANRCGLTPLDIDKGAHDNVITGCTINRMLGNIDTDVNPNTGISGFSIQGWQPSGGYAYNNIVADCTINFLKADLDAFENRACYVSSSYAYDNTIQNIRGYCDGVPLRDPSEPAGLAIIFHETISDTRFIDIHVRNASCGIMQGAEYNANMSYDNPNRFTNISNTGVMTGEIIRCDNGASSGANGIQQIYKNIDAASDLSDRGATGLPAPALCVFAMTGSSNHAAIVKDSWLQLQNGSGNEVCFYASISKFGMENLKTSGFDAGDRLLYDNADRLRYIGFKDVLTDNGRTPYDCANLFNSCPANVVITGAISDVGLEAHIPSTLYSSSTSTTLPITTPIAGNISEQIKINKFSKVAGDYIGWVRVGTGFRRYGQIET